MKLYTLAIQFDDEIIGKNGWTIHIYPSTIESPSQFLKAFYDKYAGNGIVNVVILSTEIIKDMKDFPDCADTTLI